MLDDRDPKRGKASAEESKSSAGYELQSILQVYRTVGARFAYKMLQPKLTACLSEAEAKGNFYLKFLDQRSNCEGEFFPPAISISVDNSSSYYSIIFLPYKGENPVNVKFYQDKISSADLSEANGIRDIELTNFVLKAESSLESHKIVFTNYECRWFSFDSKQEFLKALDILVKGKIIQELPTSIEEMLAMYKLNIKDALAKLAEKGEEAWAAEVYEDVRFSQYPSKIREFKGIRDRISQDRSIHDLIKLMESSPSIFLVMATKYSLSDGWGLGHPAVNFLMLYTSRSSDFPMYLEKILVALEHSLSEKINTVLLQALTFEKLIACFNYAKETPETTLLKNLLKYPAVKVVINTDEQINKCKDVIAKLPPELQTDCLKWLNRLQFQTQAAVIAQGKLGRFGALIKLVMLFAGSEKGKTEEEQNQIFKTQSNVVDASISKVNASKNRKM